MNYLLFCKIIITMSTHEYILNNYDKYKTYYEYDIMYFLKTNKMIVPEKYSVLDPSIASYNIGNSIIRDAIESQLLELFPDDFIIRLPMANIKTNARKYVASSKLTFVGGTNALNCDIRRYHQLDLSFHNIMILRRLVLMGVGWWQYENRNISAYTKWAYNRILSRDYIHSVRDSYTQERLREIGIDSINTGCPTLWNINDKLVKCINSKSKSDEAIVTLTDYNRNPTRDKLLLDKCSKCYAKIHLFIQGTGDVQYFSTLGHWDNIFLVAPKLEYLNNLLDSKNVDYIGTRLHAGIRSLQKGARSYIIAIDNRSMEMNKDFGVPVVLEDNINDIDSIVSQPYNLCLNIPYANIAKWKSQFIR